MLLKGKFIGLTVMSFGLLLAICGLRGDESRTTPFVIQKDFTDSSGLKELNIMPGTWKVVDGELRNAQKSVEFEFGDPDWNDYEIDCKVRRLATASKDQHFGVIVRRASTPGVRLYCRGDSIIYWHGKQHEVLKPLEKPMPADADSPWTSFRITVKGSTIKVYVDNALLGTLDNVTISGGRIRFYACNVDIAIKDLKILVTKTGRSVAADTNESSRNMLHNSSFEQCTLDDLPDYWGCPHWGLADPYWAVRFDEWRKLFVTDKTMAYDGKRSMKIINPFDRESSGLTLWSVCVGAKLNENYSLSAYMKSSPSGIKVRVGGRPGSNEEKIITLTDGWKRYSVPFIRKDNGPYSDMIKIAPMEKGIVWIDAIQLEEGELSPYQPMKNDISRLKVEEGNVDKILTEVPKYRPIFFADKHLKLDGILDDKVWEQIPILSLLTSAGQAVKNQTETKVWYSNQGIYVGVKCIDDNASKNKCNTAARDGNVWNDPSIEIFIDPQLSRSYYYHLAVNQIGTQYDGYCGDSGWNGNWRAATYTDPMGKYWSAEFFIPFAELKLDPTSSDLWGFNICRENHVLHEYSCWSPTYGGFHSPERFGQIDIDRKVQENYYVGCDYATLQGDQLSVQLYNKTNRDSEYRLEAKVIGAKGDESVSFTKEIELTNAKGKKIELGKINAKSGEEYRLDLKIFSIAAKYLCFSGIIDLDVPAALSVKPQYSLYTTEKSLLVKVDLNLGQELLNNGCLRLSICNSDGKEMVSKTISNPSANIETEIGIGTLANGDYKLNAEFNVNQISYTDYWKFSKHSGRKNVVKPDHFSRMMTINNKPFFPVAIFLEGNTTTDCIQYYAQNGINCIEFTHKNHEDTRIILDCAAENNVMAMLHLHGPKNDQAKTEHEKIIKAFNQHPAILGWRFYDEIFTMKWGRENYKYIMSIFDEFQNIDPYHPFMEAENSYGLSYLRNSKLEYPGATILVDYYAFPPSCSPQLVSTYARQMYETGKKKGSPCWMYLFGGGYTFWASRDLTPQEQEFQTYIAIINGISGIIYLADHPKSKSNWERLKGLFQEIEVLTPILSSTLSCPVVKCNSPAIEFIVKKTPEGVYLIAANNTRDSVQARFDLSAAGIASEAEVLFENRKSKIVNRTLDDRFDGFQRHVYLLKLQ